MSRILIAGTHSGCGKTTVTCAVLQALKDRGLRVAPFKCGPDYLDPMLHARITGVPSHNLDRHFCSRETVRALLCAYAGEISVIEGVMGYYDGGEGSSYQLAADTETPVILILDCRGMGESFAAVLQGFAEYRPESRIAGVICNRLSPRMEDMAKSSCARLGIRYFGAFPQDSSCALESRHLGLKMPDETEDFSGKMSRLAAHAEHSLDVDALLECAKAAPPLSAAPLPHPPAPAGKSPRIAVAMDSAFCFYYAETLDLLRLLGCQLVPFSPLADSSLPEGTDGLLLGGGYPERYAAALSENSKMRCEVKEAVQGGLPTIAECGGFLYLHETLEAEDGKHYPMAGVFPARAERTAGLRRFGYSLLTARQDSLLCAAGETLHAHEYHYWESSSCGDAFSASQHGETYFCCHAAPTLYAGFPHLYLCADKQAAERFVRRCRKER